MHSKGSCIKCVFKPCFCSIALRPESDTIRNTYTMRIAKIYFNCLVFTKGSIINDRTTHDQYKLNTILSCIDICRLLRKFEDIDQLRKEGVPENI